MSIEKIVMTEEGFTCEFAYEEYKKVDQIVKQHGKDPYFDLRDYFNDPCEGCLARVDKSCPDKSLWV